MQRGCPLTWLNPPSSGDVVSSPLSLRNRCVWSPPQGAGVVTEETSSFFFFLSPLPAERFTLHILVHTNAHTDTHMHTAVWQCIIINQHMSLYLWRQCYLKYEILVLCWYILLLYSIWLISRRKQVKTHLLSFAPGMVAQSQQMIEIYILLWMIQVS